MEQSSKNIGLFVDREKQVTRDLLIMQEKSTYPHFKIIKENNSTKTFRYQVHEMKHYTFSDKLNSAKPNLPSCAQRNRASYNKTTAMYYPLFRQWRCTLQDDMICSFRKRNALWKQSVILRAHPSSVFVRLQTSEMCCMKCCKWTKPKIQLQL